MEPNTYTEANHTTYRDSTRTFEAKSESVHRRTIRRGIIANGGRF